MPKIIFIHGRGQKKFNHEELRQTWIRALKDGLAHHQYKLASDVKIMLPFYGVELDQLRKDDDLGTEDYIITEKGEPFSDADTYILQLLTELANNAGISTSDIEAEYTLSVQEKGMRNWEWVLAIARALDKHSKWGPLSIQLLTRDVFDYLTKPMIRKRINSIVLNEIGNDPCLVIGHSLGSIVGYNVLHENPTLNVAGYITLGSPLGLHSMSTKINTPIKMPECIKGRWFNAYDEKDIVALRPLTKDFFDITPEVTNYPFADNKYSDHHGIEGYLSDPTVAQEVMKYLQN